MKAPSQEAIDRALKILWADIRDTDSLEATSSFSNSQNISDSDWTLQWTALNHLKRHINHLLLGLANQKNEVAPINCLPEELTVAILMQSHPSVVDTFGDYHALSSVQTRWWRIVNGHACFWKHIKSESSLDQVELSLRKSQGISLDIDVSYHKEDSDDIRDFMELIQPHTHRWRSFTFAGSRFDVVRPYLEVATPMLEKLDITADEVEDGEELDLVGGPNLTHIELLSVVPTFSNLAFSGLTTLNLHGISTDDLTLQILAGLLNNNRNIQNLSFQDIVSDEDSFVDHDFTPPAPIVFPLLRRLHICALNAEHALLLLRTIRRVHRGEFMFQTFLNNTMQTEEIWQELVTSRDGQPSILSSALSIPGITKVNLRFSVMVLALMCRSDTTLDIIRLDVSGLQTMSFLRTDLNLIPFASPSFDIPIEFRYEDLEQDEEDELVAPLLVQFMPTVTSALLDCSGKQATTLIHQLKTPNADASWPWPGLAKITLGMFLGVRIGEDGWYAFLRDLAELVELRENLPGVSPLSVHNHSDAVVEDIRHCPRYRPG